jgi:DNA-binding transcriptional LysR family regulator
MQRGASLRRSADLLLGQTIQNQRISMELDNVEAIKKMIEAKLGASLLPMLSVKAEISAGTLVAVPISSPAPPRPAIVIVHREEKYVIGAMREFIQLLCKEIPTD